MSCIYCNSGSTKSKSYAQLSIGPSYKAVLDFLEKNPVSSRSDIADGATMRIQTVCGAVRRLIDAGFLEVVGTVYDPETNREVEALARTSSANETR